MKVPLAWFALGVLLVCVALLSVKARNLLEAFRPMQEGFANEDSGSDLKVSACPSGSVSYIDDGGRTLCCGGTVSGGKCSTTPLCSLSEVVEGVPTCSAYLDALLEDKGRSFCPKSMPQYYENLDGKPPTRGCTSGPRTSDGKAPKDPSKPFCVAYTQESDELTQLNSCTNQSLLHSTKCFSSNIPDLQTTLIPNGGSPALVQCSYRDPSTSLLRTCFSDESLARAFDTDVAKGVRAKGWREGLSAEDKLLWCSKHQKVYLDKTKSAADLKDEMV